MLTTNTSPGCRFARWGWQLQRKISSCRQEPWHDSVERWCSLSRQGTKEEEVLSDVVGLFGGQDEDEETGPVCL